MARQQALERIAKVLGQVEAIGHLGGLRRPLGGALSKRPIAVTADDFNLGVRLEPGREGLGLLIRQQVNRLVAFQVDNDRRIAAALAEGKLVYADDLRNRMEGQGCAALEPEQR